MTLDTIIAVIDPAPVHELFHFCRGLLGCSDAHTWKEDESGLVMNHGNQGLPAWLMVDYGKDGPLKRDVDDDERAEGLRQTNAPMEYAVRVSFDTAYGYSGPGGMNCGQLHALLVEQVGRWCEAQGLRYAWENEFTGQWFTDWRRAADELGAASEQAREWLERDVLPAIAAHVEGQS